MMVIELPNWPHWLLWLCGIGLPVIACLGVFSAGVAASARRARQRARAAGRDVAPTRKEAIAKAGATAAALPVWAFLFYSSFLGIMGFARDFLHREGFAVYATALTTDAVVVAAVGVMFVHVIIGRPTGKARALVWGMTAFSAYCGFTYGDASEKGNIPFGVYQAVMSVVAMILLHMVIELFMPESGLVRSRYPVMGLRWLTHWSTLPVVLCWINHPPQEWNSEFAPTVREAIDHWFAFKSGKRLNRQAAAAQAHEHELMAAARNRELRNARQGRLPARAEAAPVVTVPADLPVPVSGLAAPASAVTIPASTLPVPVSAEPALSGVRTHPIVNGAAVIPQARRVNGNPASVDNDDTSNDIKNATREWIKDFIRQEHRRPTSEEIIAFAGAKGYDFKTTWAKEQRLAAESELNQVATV
jgi:hypothetical protein